MSISSLQKRVERLERLQNQDEDLPWKSVIIETDGSCKMMDSDLTFPSEEAFDKYFESVEANLFKIHIVEP